MKPLRELLTLLFLEKKKLIGKIGLPFFLVFYIAK